MAAQHNYAAFNLPVRHINNKQLVFVEIIAHLISVPSYLRLYLRPKQQRPCRTQGPFSS